MTWAPPRHPSRSSSGWPQGTFASASPGPFPEPTGMRKGGGKEAAVPRDPSRMPVMAPTNGDRPRPSAA
jgi:hypothetical protein